MCKRALAISPREAESIEMLAFTHYLQDEHAIAEIRLRRRLADDPGRLAIIQLARVIASGGRRSEATNCWITTATWMMTMTMPSFAARSTIRKIRSSS
ncbi:MAG: hypothetical protein IT435_08780 [Phycisphaerales bacterium]|nr:hypothetical protein [Phycisphaerales bacterium]